MKLTTFLKRAWDYAEAALILHHDLGVESFVHPQVRAQTFPVWSYHYCINKSARLKAEYAAKYSTIEHYIVGALEASEGQLVACARYLRNGKGLWITQHPIGCCPACIYNKLKFPGRKRRRKRKKKGV